VRWWTLLLILGMAAATYVTRISFLVLGKRIRFSETAMRCLKHIPTAILAALIFPAVLAPTGDLALSPSNPYLIAALATAATTRITRSSVAGIFVGMALILALRAGW